MAQNRFESKFTKHENGCWIWNAARRTTGYGVFSFNGKPTTASRVSYTLYHGVDPGDLFVCHTCDVPSCVNPEHLFLGTNLDNVNDRIAKNRPAGRYSTLTEEQYLQVKQYLLDNSSISLREIARRTGINRATVHRIAKNNFTLKFKENSK